MPRKYRKPPVVEALCEIFFAESPWDSTLPGIFYQSVKTTFPVKQELKQMDLAVEVANGSASTRMQPVEPRSRFLSQDSSRMVQVAKDLLVVNQLPPYPRFEDWRPVVLEMYKTYLTVSSPARIARMAVRYINKVIIPETDHPMEQYFRLYPEVPAELGEAHGRFSLRLQIPAKNKDHALLVTFGSASTDGTDSSAYLLDLYDHAPAINSMELGEVELRIDEGHENIEHAFENIITDDCRNLFEVEG